MPLSDGSLAYFSFAVVDGTGAITRMGQAEYSLIGEQAVDAGESVISPIPEPISGVLVAAIGPEVSDETHYWDGAEFQEYPARPSEHAIWDGEEWLVRPPAPNEFCVWNGTAWEDTRIPTYYDDQLRQARYNTDTPKEAVFYALAQAGFIPMAELSDDTTYFPATIEDYLSSLTPAEHDLVKAAMKYEPNIWRLHEYIIGDAGAGIQGFVAWLAAERSLTITETQLDEVFGVPVPPPLYTP